MPIVEATAPTGNPNQSMAAAQPSGSSRAPAVSAGRHHRLSTLAVAAALIIGAVLRLAWPNDIEYKADEAYFFSHSQAHGPGAFPALGIPTSAGGILSPGTAVWIFVILARVFNAHDPGALAHSVQILNILALIFVIGFTARCVPREQREPWLWAAVLACVNPFAVLAQRKLWNPSLLPLVSILAITGWWCRSARSGAALWGFTGVIAGQIHIAGFFYTAGFALWSMLLDRKRVAWGSFAAGASLAALPMIPWLAYLSNRVGHGPGLRLKWKYIAELGFFRRWAVEPFGLGLHATLGGDFPGFLVYPQVFARPTYAVAILSAIIALLAIAIAARRLGSIWRARASWRDLWIGRGSETAFTQNAALWGFGILMTLTGLKIHRHYLAASFPLEFLWAARLALGRPDDPSARSRMGRAMLIALWFCELMLSICLLGYLHAHHGAPHGDYGISLAAQRAK